MPSESNLNLAGEPFLIIQRQHSLPPLVFQTLAEFRTAFSRDSQEWSWLSGYADRNDPSGHVGKQFRNITKRVNEALAKQDASSTSDKKKDAAELIQAAKDFYVIE